AHREAVLNAGPWDLVFVDEAHHARRRGIGGAEGANQLLQLLRAMRDGGTYQALLLATATPMQMNTHEIYDLMDLFGLPGTWGGGEDVFDFYYRQLGEPDPKAREWPPMRAMLGDYLAQADVSPNPLLLERLSHLGGPARQRVTGFHRMSLSGAEISVKSLEERQSLDLWLRAHTPIRDRVFRTTRAALREYKRQGFLPDEAVIPTRHIDDQMIEFGSAAEHNLYSRIEDYISRYYEAYNRRKETKPLGFIMTVYRRRLTSSLYAIHRSLQRRLDAVQMEASADQLLDDDDRYALENLTNFEFDELSNLAKPYAEEIAELRAFLSELEAAVPHDSKARAAIERIKESFRAGHKTIVVFTQFTDTLEWLREQLRAEYGSMVACFTGKGGSRWDPETASWTPISKERVKELFRAGSDVRILLGTDAMSEGLNLQTCDRLINYDMPWNFMRVEQRIGRIDRIGGREEVFVTNYFYLDTVEEQVYSGIREDAAWFDQVVGPAQPVLGRIEGVIESLAMQAAGSARDQAIREELDSVRRAIKNYRSKPVTLATLESDVAPPISLRLNLDLESIERELVRNPLTSSRLHPHPDGLERTYLVALEGEKHAMTFSRMVHDLNPEIGFMTYGHPIFDGLLAIGTSADASD
ncbi:MAG TPA: helicase-related protein, partial [Acidimicrobiia bacterium]|nr:helicase-related protein [Acidimicrobiia bacterium]